MHYVILLALLASMAGGTKTIVTPRGSLIRTEKGSRARKSRAVPSASTPSKWIDQLISMQNVKEPRSKAIGDVGATGSDHAVDACLQKFTEKIKALEHAKSVVSMNMQECWRQIGAKDKVSFFAKSQSKTDSIASEAQQQMFSSCRDVFKAELDKIQLEEKTAASARKLCMAAAEEDQATAATHGSEMQTEANQIPAPIRALVKDPIIDKLPAELQVQDPDNDEVQRELDSDIAQVKRANVSPAPLYDREDLPGNSRQYHHQRHPHKHHSKLHNSSSNKHSEDKQHHALPLHDSKEDELMKIQEAQNVDVPGATSLLQEEGQTDDLALVDAERSETFKDVEGQQEEDEDRYENFEDVEDKQEKVEMDEAREASAHAKHIFAEFDSNSDGFLDSFELAELVHDNSSDWRAFDTEGEEAGNPDGRLSVVEFLRTLDTSKDPEIAGSSTSDYDDDLKSIAAFLETGDIDEEEEEDPEIKENKEENK